MSRTTTAPADLHAQDTSRSSTHFYDVARDRGNKVVILTAPAATSCRASTSTRRERLRSGRLSKVLTRGTQILEEHRQHPRPDDLGAGRQGARACEYGLLANIIVAGEDATFNDLPHCRRDRSGDGVFTLWSYSSALPRAGDVARSAADSARQAKDLGVVPKWFRATGARTAKEIAKNLLAKPEVTRRNTRIHFCSRSKSDWFGEVGYGLASRRFCRPRWSKSFQDEGKRVTS